VTANDLERSVDGPESAAPIGNPDRQSTATPAEARRDHGHKRGTIAASAGTYDEHNGGRVTGGGSAMAGRVELLVTRLLDEAEQAYVEGRWDVVRDRAAKVLGLDPQSEGARALLAAAERQTDGSGGSGAPGSVELPSESVEEVPGSFADGRYVVRRFLGEGGKKRVFLAYDSLLDREVAFALIKSEGLDEVGRERVRREAQAMGRLGAHPHIVSVFDLGEEAGQPFVVTELMGGGDVEGLIEAADEGRLALDRAIEIAVETVRGLEFAHAQGIVHRDLKPGNVWLTVDGRAKIGDFGLAVAVDRSRLTQAGMMVGTVSYMPPEQATGGEVGPHSDLYSLGAMLYEMVCGRPPFVGDESVAIIGQHLNTAPVAPSWHRPECPAALEVLILQLLAKNPRERPGSATAVRETLERLEAEPEAAPAAEGERAVNAPGPIYGRTFVGREHELAQLKDAFDAALSGQGGLVMVVGEPGIGKTALCEQLETYAVLRGGQTLVGHCYEEGSLSQPYLAFVEALRAYVLTREEADLRSDLGDGAGVVARIVSEIGGRLHVEPPAASSPEDDRWRLLEAVSAFLRNASSAKPLVVVLEDLHWADRGTLDLLQHLARGLQGARLLVVGTYRDVDVDRAHPLSAALGELRRSASLQRIALGGLTVDEVHRMISAVVGQQGRRSIAEAIYRQTEGNPLFVQEVIRLFAEEGLVKREGGRWIPPTDTLAEARIPEGLRDVIGKRLSHLSDHTNQLLASASVIGRDFDLAVLRAVAGIDDEQLETSIEEAVGVGVLEERAQTGSVRYRFAHAFFRQTLYEEIIAPRRLRQHQQIARALETHYAARLEEHAAELAEHFAQSTDHADLAKAVHYYRLAAQRATSMFAYTEAASHLERGLAVQDVLEPADQRERLELLLALGSALLDGAEPRRLLDDAAPRALTLAQELSDDESASDACTLALAALIESGGPWAFDTPEATRWVALADSLAREGSPARVHADIGLGRAAQKTMLCLAEGWPQANGRDRAMFTRARELAHTLADPALIMFADWVWMEAVKGPQFLAQRLEIADQMDSVVGHLSPRLAAWAYLFMADVYFSAGAREKVDELTTRVTELAERTKQNLARGFTTGFDALLQTGEGQLEEAMATIEHVREGWGDDLADLADVSDYLYQQPRRYLGRPFDRAAVPRVIQPSARILTYLAQPDPGLRAELDQIAAELETIPPAEDEGYPFVDAALMQAAAIERHEAIARRFIARYEGSSHVTHGVFAPVCTARLLGDAAAILGENESARQHYERARDDSTRMRIRPEWALATLGLAEVLAAGDEAQSHLDQAIAELQAMNMQPALQRALARKELLKA
jgi:hypothetical protein